jgi:penicillin-binding protein 1A
VREAVVATEDERFFRHDGIDVIGILRAVPYDITHLSLAEGASTITEQLAKLVYLGGNDHDPWAKLRDAAIAVRIESRYSKAQILDDYLNSVYFGAHAYGIQAASRRYFGAPPSKLTLAEASLLAGLIQDPTADNPYAHPSAARARQLDALRSMVSNGFATAREAKRALAHPLSLAHGPPLPPLRGARVEPGPAFYWLGLAIGLVAFALGGAALLVLRGRGGERIERVLRVVAEVGAVLVTIAGVLIVFASFRTV